MKDVITVMLMALAASAHAQTLEADLDGNASALQASEMRPAPKPQRPAPRRPAPQQTAQR